MLLRARGRWAWSVAVVCMTCLGGWLIPARALADGPVNIVFDVGTVGGFAPPPSSGCCSTPNETLTVTRNGAVVASKSNGSGDGIIIKTNSLPGHELLPGDQVGLTSDGEDTAELTYEPFPTINPAPCSATTVTGNAGPYTSITVTEATTPAQVTMAGGTYSGTFQSPLDGHGILYTQGVYTTTGPSGRAVQVTSRTSSICVATQASYRIDLTNLAGPQGGQSFLTFGRNVGYPGRQPGTTVGCGDFVACPGPLSLNTIRHGRVISRGRQTDIAVAEATLRKGLRAGDTLEGYVGNTLVARFTYRSAPSATATCTIYPKRRGDVLGTMHIWGQTGGWHVRVSSLGPAVSPFRVSGGRYRGTYALLQNRFTPKPNTDYPSVSFSKSATTRTGEPLSLGEVTEWTGVVPRSDC